MSESLNCALGYVGMIGDDLHFVNMYLVFWVGVVVAHCSSGTFAVGGNGFAVGSSDLNLGSGNLKIMTRGSAMNELVPR